MESKLLKITMNSGSKDKVKALLNYMKSNIEFPKDEMKQKGYYWDSVFYDTDKNNEYMYILLKSEDFSKIMMDESELDETPFRKVYEIFRLECWAPEHYKDIEVLSCFNCKMEFSEQ